MLVTVGNIGKFYCEKCGHDSQYHAHRRVIISGKFSTTPVCERGACKCGKNQNPKVEGK